MNSEVEQSLDTELSKNAESGSQQECLPASGRTLRWGVVLFCTVVWGGVLWLILS